MRPFFFCDPLLPGPEDHQLDCGRRLNGPKKPNPENMTDYDRYCELYAQYVICRQPFWRKPDQLVDSTKKQQLDDLDQIIQKLSNCNYVHSFGGAKTRIVALYDYQTKGNMDVVHDISSSRNWMFPTPGGSRTEKAKVTTTYFDQDPAENYVPERGIITGEDGTRVFQADDEVEPHKRYKKAAHEVCLSIGKHPDTATQYASLLWASVKGQ